MPVSEPEPGLRRILAPNPSPMTEAGTNTYLLGEGAVTVIDPGPAMGGHLQAILTALAPGEKIARILVTHSHRDHSALVPALAEATGAPVLAFGDNDAGRSPHLADLAGIGGGEGADRTFAPDERLAHGEVLDILGARLRAHWTPGHFGNHMCFEWQGAVFTGDTVMGWASSLVSPPDGDLTAFMASLDLLDGLRARRLYPGHGAPVTDPAARIGWLRDHRMSREAQILAALSDGPADAATLAARVYTDIPTNLQPAATRNALAHLIDLAGKNRVTHAGVLAVGSVFSLP